MYCKNCGYKINDEKFCPNCGTKIMPLIKEEKIEEEVIEIVEPEIENEEVKIEYNEKERLKQKAYSVIAKVGYGLGIGTFCASFMVPGILFLGIGAFIMCCFGKKSKTAYRKAKTGFGLSLAGMIINTVLMAVTF